MLGKLNEIEEKAVRQFMGILLKAIKEIEPACRQAGIPRFWGNRVYQGYQGITSLDILGTLDIPRT